MSTEPQPFRWRSIALPAFLPTFLFSIGEGAIIPMIPIVASNLGADLSVAGLIAALLLVGELVGTVPAGWLVSRIGERIAMIGAALLSVVGLLSCILAPNTTALGVGVFLIGLAAAIFALARHAFLTSFVPLSHRARALSTLGGVFRAGYFVGPFLAAASIHLTGAPVSAFWIHVGSSLAAAAVLIGLGSMDLTESRSAGVDASTAIPSSRMLHTIKSSAPVLLRVGSGAALLSAMRAGRTVILPLWAVSIGIPDASTAIIIGIAGAIDFALFYTGGQIMDRFGRLWTAMPAMIGFAIGYFALSLTHDVDARAGWFVAVAVFLALANGISSGILMTLGADLADKRNPAPFLGAWRLTTGLGLATAPLVIAGVTAVATLPVAVAVTGVGGLIGAGILLRYVPRR